MQECLQQLVDETPDETAGSVSRRPREITVNSLDLAGLMDQLEEICQNEAPPGTSRRGR